MSKSKKMCCECSNWEMGDIWQANQNGGPGQPIVISEGWCCSPERNHPNPQFRHACRNGDPCHESAPRGSKTGLHGIQDKTLRSAYPPLFCEHIVDICERYADRDGVPCRFGRTITAPDLFGC